MLVGAVQFTQQFVADRANGQHDAALGKEERTMRYNSSPR
jgi:hypothetical protein